LIYLLVSPLAWDAHYILALIPLVYLWMKSQDTRIGASPGKIAILAGSTLLFGVTAPSHLAGGLNSFVVFLFLLSLWIVADLALIWVGMSLYAPCTGDPADDRS
jgi:hypothetical protein